MEAHEYSGHVERAGPVARRTVATADGTVEIRKLSVGAMDNNAYVLVDTGSGAALLIDAADEAERLLAEVDGMDLTAIVTTHGHRDHWQALNRLADLTGAPVWLHPDDASMVPRAADRAAAHDEVLRFGAGSVRLLHTPGHTSGSTCLLLGDGHLFTGDTLFPGGPGRTTSVEDFAAIMRSLRERVFTLGDDTWVYPGHGDDTTLGAERGSLDEWQARGW
ncbi:MAG: MBL fold metallo-hydrolase [Actinomycetota bacterium]|nr:MBL fold metallo-hydrolase [Actinomycetota bacterium]